MNTIQTTFENELARPITSQKSITEPALWFKGLKLVKQLNPVTEKGNLIRSYSFNTGLNILWAEPEKADENANLYNDSFAGHSTGKTLFCRILRYILNETNYGTDELHDHVKETFDSLWVIAEIRLNQQSWLIGRNLKSMSEDFAIQTSSLSIEEILETPPEFEGYGNFTKDLESLCPASLQNIYPAGSWKHLIPWIARDQEERFASITSWRSSLSGSDNPKTSKEERHLILRAMLKILDEDEYTTRKTIDKFNEDNRAIEANLPLKRKLLEQIRGRVDALYPKIPNLNLERADIGADRDYVTKQREIREESLERFESLPEHTEIIQARENLQEVISLKDIKKSQITFLKIEIPNLEKKAEDKLVSVERTKTKGLQDPSRIEKNWCPNSYQIACDEGCVTDHEIGSNSILSELEEEAEELKRNYEAKKTDLAKAESEIDQAEATILKEKETLQATLKKHPSTAVKIQQEIDKLELLEGYLDEELESASNVKDDCNKLDVNRRELEKSNAELRLFKEEANDKLKVFSGIFGDVTRAVVGSSIRGSVVLTKSSGLKPKIEKKRELGGAAMETVKTIAFDLASIIHSAEGNGFHPRFLIHDGPRESDMAQVMYEHFFRYMQKLEQEFPEDSIPFQYILTTTTPPPQGMRENTKWLLGEKLSGKNEEGRLLRADF